MKRNKWIIISCIVAALFIFGTIMLFSTGILIFNGRNAGIALPDVETVTHIEMGRKYDWNIYSGGVSIEDKNEIEEIISSLSEARKPIVTSFLRWARTANETPGSRTHLSINFGGRSIFLYTETSRGYVYVPYGGLYRIDRDVIEKLVQLYERHEPK